MPKINQNSLGHDGINLDLIKSKASAIGMTKPKRNNDQRTKHKKIMAEMSKKDTKYKILKKIIKNSYKIKIMLAFKT